MAPLSTEWLDFNASLSLTLQASLIYFALLLCLSLIYFLYCSQIDFLGHSAY